MHGPPPLARWARDAHDVAVPERVVDLDGYRTRVVDDGEGDPIVLVHGTPFDLRAWDALAAQLRGRRVIRYDVRGHGSAGGVAVPSIPALAGDLVDLLDRLDLPDAHLVGHSWGGQIVQRATLDHPRRVRRLSLLCTRASPFPAFHTLAAGLRDGTADPLASLERWFGPEERARPTAFVGVVREVLRRADPHTWGAALDTIADFDVLAELPAILAPVDVVAAELDGVGAPGHMALVADALPCATFEVLPGARHLAPLHEVHPVAQVLLTRPHR